MTNEQSLVFTGHQYPGVQSPYVEVWGLANGHGKFYAHTVHKKL